MVQRKVGMYLANRIKDEIMTSPKNGAEMSEDGDYRRDDRGDQRGDQRGIQRVDSRSDRGDDLDGQILRDEDGNSLGRTYRVVDVAIYVIAKDGRNPAADLRRAIQNDAGQIHFQTTESGRITSIIYVADEGPKVEGLRGARADDV